MQYTKATPTYGNQESLLVPEGKSTGGYPAVKDKLGTSAHVSLLTGLNKDNEISTVSIVEGAIPVTDSGFYPDVVTFIYYVREGDYSLYQGVNPLYVDGSLGRHKKIVSFKKGAFGNDLAQVTILYYQVPAFPTKITSIQTFYDKVYYYTDVSYNPFYDYNSAAQQSISPNP